MSVPSKIRQLVEKFDAGFNEFKLATYGETQVRVAFINPFFEALGWDMTNRNNREVTHEYALLDDRLSKIHPDYCFNGGGPDKMFFVEAKKPSVNLEAGFNPALQIRRYAWTANHPIGVLTDFEEFSAYYGRGIEPKTGDGPDVARFFYCNFRDYLKRWDEIYAIFSREAVLSGSLERNAYVMKSRRGSQEVDDVFLNDIEAWRSLLASHIASYNPNLTQRELNASVQQTIDRIIFLRICEDREIEPYGTLEKLLSSTSIYQKLVRLFRDADAKYNSGLFHFQDDPKRGELADTIALNLTIHDEPLRQIIQRLYFPHGPYAFSVMPADILGHVYERFLGKIIQVQADRSVVVEEKPEVRKAGGVYYTPTYIVDYIVRNTVGKLLDGKRPDEVSGIRVLDPACGSGSFLIRAYQYLLDWHLEWYLNHDPKKHARGKAPKLYRDSNDHWHLAIAERKRILLNNIYGVDIDAQAVEVSKLSLLLKVLEGEDSQSMNRQLALFRERALPDLGNNIKCGNSLIGRDFYAGQQTSLFGMDEKLRINAFDWEVEFADVMKAGGFDAVIGNPPYVRIQNMKEWAPAEVEFYKKRYHAASKGNYDLYVVMVEKGLSLLNPNGKLGFILPHKFFNAQYGEPLRSLIAAGKHLAEVVHFGDQQVFAGATTYTCLLFLSKDGASECSYQKVDDLAVWRATGQATAGTISASAVIEAEWNFAMGAGAAMFEKLRLMPLKLLDVAARMYQGPITSADTVYLFKDHRPSMEKGLMEVFSKELGDWVTIESVILKPVVRGGDIGRYGAAAIAFVLFPYKVYDCKARLFSVIEMQSQFPLAWEYLNRNKKLLENREKGKFQDVEWYRFGRTQNLGLWEQTKLMIPYMVTRLAAYLDLNGYYFINVTTGGYGITVKEPYSLNYICGIINSRLIDFCFKNIATTFHGGYFAANKQYIEQLPIRPIDFNDPTDAARHARMVELVQKMLDLHKQLAVTRLRQEIEEIKRDIAYHDKEIDRLVYELYGLTDKEIAIVEGG